MLKREDRKEVVRGRREEGKKRRKTEVRGGQDSDEE